MASMQPDARTLTRAGRVTAVLGAAGRWLLVTIGLCLALVGFLQSIPGAQR
jgi:hypothetical protein